MQHRIMISFLLGLAVAYSPRIEAQVSTWKDFTSKEDGFVVSLPTAPTIISKDNDYKFGTVTIRAYTSNPRPNVVWRVAAHNYPETFMSQIKPEKLIELMRDGMAKNAKGKADEVKQIKLDGHPGEEFVVLSSDPLTNKPLTIKTRLFAVNSRIYQVTVIAPPTDDALGEETMRYFKSFRLSKKKDE
jgi:hypothetical protein